MARMQAEKKALPSGRWLWIGGTKWINKENNFSGAYNCTSTNLVDWEAFGLMMDLAMMGCGTGAIIEPHLINQLPIIKNPLNIQKVTAIGITPGDTQHPIGPPSLHCQVITLKLNLSGSRFQIDPLLG